MLKLVLIFSLASTWFRPKGAIALHGACNKSSKVFLREAPFKVYAFEVIMCLDFVYYFMIAIKKRTKKNEFKPIAMQYPPFMYAVKDSTNGNKTYQGFTVEFINYFAHHFRLR